MITLIIALLGAVEQPIAESEVMGQCETSHVAVYSSGYAHFEVTNTCGTSAFSFQSGLRKIMTKDVENLKSILARARVGSLPARIKPPRDRITTGETVLGLRVWQKGEMKEVIAYGIDRAEDRDAAHRFKLARQAVERLGPEVK